MTLRALAAVAAATVAMGVLAISALGDRRPATPSHVDVGKRAPVVIHGCKREDSCDIDYRRVKGGGIWVVRWDGRKG